MIDGRTALATITLASLSPREVFEECVPNEEHSKQACNRENEDTEQTCRNVDTQGRWLTFQHFHMK